MPGEATFVGRNYTPTIGHCERCTVAIIDTYNGHDAKVVLDARPYPIGGYVFVGPNKVHAVTTAEQVRQGVRRYRRHWC